VRTLVIQIAPELFAGSVYKRSMSWALLNGIPPEQARLVLSLARRRRFARREVVFHEGDPGDTLHLIDRGHVAIRVTTPLGDTATLRIVGPGEHFGELAVVSPAPRNATAIALEQTETWALHRNEMNALRAQHPEVEQALLEAVVGAVRRMSQALLDALYVPVERRLIRQLSDLAGTYPADEKGEIVIPLTQDDLASLAGTTRPTVNQLLAKLVDRGLLRISRGRVTIIDLSGLTSRIR
jgi:CRP/FNR family transcriptional regulator, cyclic AMP receptor protein